MYCFNYLPKAMHFYKIYFIPQDGAVILEVEGAADIQLINTV